MPTQPKLHAAPVEADIRIARTLPADFYRSTEVFEASKDRVFAKSWQFVGDTDKLKVAGHAVPFTALEGYLNEPLLLTRDTNDQVNCLSNVCTHRGNLLVEGECHAQQFRCRYHGRRFALDGRFVSTPGFDGVSGFPTAEDNLPWVPFETWGKFVFTSINPAFALDDAIGDMKKRMGWLPLDEFVFDPNRSRDYIVKANWALYCDNYLEGFHVPYVHPDLAVLLDTKGYRTELFKYSNLQIGPAAKPEDAFNLPKESPEYGQNIAAYYYWLFPNTMFNFYPWGISVNVVVPLAVDRARIKFFTYVWDESRMGSYSTSDIDKTEREDEDIVEHVQKGISSRFYNTGRYSPQWEAGVHHFHSLLGEFLGGSQ
jgi:choline monooxygenase